MAPLGGLNSAVQAAVKQGAARWKPTCSRQLLGGECDETARDPATIVVFALFTAALLTVAFHSVATQSDSRPIFTGASKLPHQSFVELAGAPAAHVAQYKMAAEESQHAGDASSSAMVNAARAHHAAKAAYAKASASGDNTAIGAALRLLNSAKDKMAAAQTAAKNAQEKSKRSATLKEQVDNDNKAEAVRNRAQGLAKAQERTAAADRAESKASAQKKKEHDILQKEMDRTPSYRNLVKVNHHLEVEMKTEEGEFRSLIKTKDHDLANMRSQLQTAASLGPRPKSAVDPQELALTKKELEVARNGLDAIANAVDDKLKAEGA